jgi:hypothetical protein
MCIFAKKLNLCQYKNIFGEPGTGAHSYRIFNIAIVDVVFTIIFALIIWWFTGYPIHWVILFTFILGIIVHRIFCVNSTVNKFIFGKV